MDKRLNILEKAPIPKAVFSMALPSIIGMLVMAIYNVVDTMFVAWLGTNATGATQIVFPLMMIAGAIGLTLGIGGGSYISRLLGKNDHEKANQVVSTVFVTAIILGVVFLVIGLIFLEPILDILGATGGIRPFAKDYASYILFASVAQIVNMALNNMLRAEGSAKNSMFGMMAGSILNIILDPILIFGLNMGIQGAAIATAISQVVTTFILTYQYLSRRSVLRLYLKKVKFELDMYKEILVIGTPSFFRQIFVSISTGLVNNAAVTYGSASTVAAIGIVMRTMMLIMYVIFGLSQGFQPIAGYNYGAGNFDRLKETLKFTMKASFMIALVFSLIFLFFGEVIFMIYRPAPDVLEIAMEFLKYYLVSLVLMSISNVIATYYQALGKGFQAFILSISRQGLTFVPAVLILPRFFGVSGIFLAQPAADFITLVITIGLYFVTEKSLNRKANSLILETD
jgi:putative MATE family efflux protein